MLFENHKKKKCGFSRSATFGIAADVAFHTLSQRDFSSACLTERFVPYGYPTSRVVVNVSAGQLRVGLAHTGRLLRPLSDIRFAMWPTVRNASLELDSGSWEVDSIWLFGTEGSVGA